MQKNESVENIVKWKRLRSMSVNLNPDTEGNMSAVLTRENKNITCSFTFVRDPLSRLVSAYYTENLFLFKNKMKFDAGLPGGHNVCNIYYQ